MERKHSENGLRTRHFQHKLKRFLATILMPLAPSFVYPLSFAQFTCVRLFFSLSLVDICVCIENPRIRPDEVTR